MPKTTTKKTVKKEVKEPVVATSPVPPKKEEPLFVDFLGAMKAILEGKRVRRIAWPEGEYACTDAGWIKIFKGSYNAWIISDGDYASTDWQILK